MAATASLRGLPREVRLEIWKHVFAGTTIHISSIVDAMKPTKDNEIVYFDRNFNGLESAYNRGGWQKYYITGTDASARIRDSPIIQNLTNISSLDMFCEEVTYMFKKQVVYQLEEKSVRRAKGQPNAFPLMFSTSSILKLTLHARQLMSDRFSIRSVFPAEAYEQGVILPDFPNLKHLHVLDDHRFTVHDWEWESRPSKHTNRLLQLLHWTQPFTVSILTTIRVSEYQGASMEYGHAYIDKDRNMTFKFDGDKMLEEEERMVIQNHYCIWEGLNNLRLGDLIVQLRARK